MQMTAEQLQAELNKKEQDIQELADFIFKTFAALGVKDFNDLDKIGKTCIKAMPTILSEAALFPHKLKARFAHFDEAQKLLEQYKHLIPNSQ